MAKRNPYARYHGRSYQRPRDSAPNQILRGIVIVLFVLLLILAAALFLLQDYIVYSDSGIRLDLPWLAGHTPSPPPGKTSPILIEGESSPSPAVSPSSSAHPSPSLPKETPLHAVQVSTEELLAGSAAHIVKTMGGNAALITVKEDSGRLNYVSSLPVTQSTGASGTDSGVNDALATLEQEGLYTVARFSCFRDHLMPTLDPNLSIRTTSGYCWEDHGAVRWTSPAVESFTDYLTELCVELAGLGFDEILLTNCGYPAAGVGNLSWIRRDEAYPEGQLDTVLTPFLEKVRTALEPYGVKLSVWATGSELTGETENTGLTMDNVLSSCHRFWVDGAEADPCAAAAGDDFDSALRLVSFLSAPGGEDSSWAVLRP